MAPSQCRDDVRSATRRNEARRQPGGRDLHDSHRPIQTILECGGAQPVISACGPPGFAKVGRSEGPKVPPVRLSSRPVRPTRTRSVPSTEKPPRSHARRGGLGAAGNSPHCRGPPPAAVRTCDAITPKNHALHRRTIARAKECPYGVKPYPPAGQAVGARVVPAAIGTEVSSGKWGAKGRRSCVFRFRPPHLRLGNPEA